MDGPGSPVDHEVDVEGEGGEQEEDAHHNPHQGQEPQHIRSVQLFI